jgi:hypothetical protein
VGKRDSGTRLDSLHYTAVDDAGNPVLEVIDYEMDGQLDLRMHYGSPGYAEIWHVDRWLRIERSANGSGVYINGQFKKVVSEDGRLHVDSHD